MGIANLSLEYVKTLVWPAVVIFLVILYHDTIRSLFLKSKVKLSLFGLSEIEMNLSELENSLTATVGGKLEDRQWDLLREILKNGSVSVNEKKFDMSGEDLRWIRPLRNAGLIKTLPDGMIIELAKSLELTPLGKIVTEKKFG